MKNKNIKKIIYILIPIILTISLIMFFKLTEKPLIPEKLNKEILELITKEINNPEGTEKKCYELTKNDYDPFTNESGILLKYSNECLKESFNAYINNDYKNKEKMIEILLSLKEIRKKQEEEMWGDHSTYITASINTDIALSLLFLGHNIEENMTNALISGMYLVNQDISGKEYLFSNLVILYINSKSNKYKEETIKMIKRTLNEINNNTEHKEYYENIFKEKPDYKIILKLNEFIND